MVNAERLRLDEADEGGVSWRRWGPYLSERQWGTVREDYGDGDDTWSYFSHDQARSRAYRWVFARTWSGRTGPAPDAEFWPAMLGKLRARHPEAVMIAEAYWDMEWALQQQGFDFCYDKRLYDRIISRESSAARDHLHADLSYQSRLMRFLENHDEPRIASCLPGNAERAAAVVIATLPGANLWHEGQFEGRRVRPPVFLSRRPDEAPDVELASWYRHLLAAVDSHQVRDGAELAGPGLFVDLGPWQFHLLAVR